METDRQFYYVNLYITLQKL